MPTEIKEVEAAPYRRECIADTVETLSHALEQAKRGEITSVVMGMTVPGGGAITASSKTDNLICLIGALEIAKSRLLKDVDE